MVHGDQPKEVQWESFVEGQVRNEVKARRTVESKGHDSELQSIASLCNVGRKSYHV